MMRIGLAAVHLLCKHADSAQAVLERVGRRPDSRLFAVYIASIRTFEGKKDEAFALLDRGPGLP